MCANVVVSLLSTVQVERSIQMVRTFKSGHVLFFKQLTLCVIISASFGR